MTRHKQHPAELRVLEMCRRLNVRVEQRGSAWHLYGPGVDITTTSLSYVRESELLPAWRTT